MNALLAARVRRLGEVPKGPVDTLEGNGDGKAKEVPLRADQNLARCPGPAA
jgi:hypothetical protein